MSATVVNGSPVVIRLTQNPGVGPPGLSAYGVAVANGFVGTEAEWLASLGVDMTAGQLLAKIITVDGTGSGLDADTVDGLNATAFDAAGAATAAGAAALATAAAAAIAKSTLTVDGNIVTRAAGAPAEITRATLATDTAFTSRFGSVVPGVYHVTDYGTVDVTGATDSSTAVLAALTAWQLTGGELVWPGGIIRVNSAIVLTNDGAAQPNQRSGKWTGTGATFNGAANSALVAPYGGTILDLRYTGGGTNIAKIDTRGLGTLEITGITFTDFGTSSNPFIHTTNTTLLVHHCAFVGNAAKIRPTCDQDAFILGGLGTVFDGTYDSAFQGYGTTINANYFARIRRGMLVQTFGNSITFSDNTFWANCGTNLAGGAAIEFAPASPQFCVGCTVWNNLIEVLGYVYAVTGDRVTSSVFMNHAWDYNAGTLAVYNFGDNGVFNTVIAGAYTDSKPLVIETATSLNTNTQINGHQSKPSVFAQNVTLIKPSTVAGLLTFTGQSTQGPLIQPALTQSDSSILLQAKRSAAEASNPSTLILQLAQNGNIIIGGSSAGTITAQDAAAAAVGGFSAGFKNWFASGTGGAMTINTGTGGSYLTVRAFGLILLDYLGVKTATLKVGTGTPEGAIALPTGSVFLRTDGGTGTSFYVKETGAATNTGWVAK